MKQTHIKTWFNNFPNLRFILSKEDKAILDKIDPAKYRDFNLSRDSEVLSIIEEYKPQAWKWIRLYPNLKNISAEDYAILNHIVPNDFVNDISEKDVRRIINYRKEKLRRQKEDKEYEANKQYQETHAEEIAKNEKRGMFLTKLVKWATVLGSSLITAGFAIHGTASRSGLYLASGALLVVVPWIVCPRILKKLDTNIKSQNITQDGAPLDFMSIAFIALFYVSLFGTGILLGTLFTYLECGWIKAEPVLWTGLATILGAALMFVILAIAAPSKK